MSRNKSKADEYPALREFIFGDPKAKVNYKIVGITDSRNPKGDTMKKAKIKPRPEVRASVRYWGRRGRRVLGLKKSEYDELHIDFMDPPGTAEVWFFATGDLVGWAIFSLDGRMQSCGDKRPGKQK